MYYFLFSRKIIFFGYTWCFSQENLIFTGVLWYRYNLYDKVSKLLRSFFGSLSWNLLIVFCRPNFHYITLIIIQNTLKNVYLHYFWSTCLFWDSEIKNFLQMFFCPQYCYFKIPLIRNVLIKTNFCITLSVTLIYSF